MSNLAAFGITFTIVLELLGFLFHRSRLLSFVQMIWVVILSCFNLQSADYINNYQVYESLGTAGKSFSIFAIIGSYARQYGMSFSVFNGILTALSTIAIYIVIIKLSKNPSLVMSFILIYPLVDDIIQKRFYYAMGIIILGIFYSLKTSSLSKKVFILIATSLLASQFHEAAIFFIILPFYLLLSYKEQIYSSILVIIMGSIFRGNIANVVNYIGGNSLQEKASLYFSTLSANTSLWDYLFWTCWQLIQFGAIYYLYKKHPKNNFIYNVYIINIWALMIIPFYSFDPVFSRIFRCILIFNYIVISNELIIKDFKISKTALYIVILQFTICMISIYVFDLRSALGLQTILYDIFDYNGMFNFLFH